MRLKHKHKWEKYANRLIHLNRDFQQFEDSAVLSVEYWCKCGSKRFIIDIIKQCKKKKCKK